MSSSESSCPSENEVDDTAAPVTIATPDHRKSPSPIANRLRPKKQLDHVLVIVCLIVGYTLSISPWLLVSSFVMSCDINCNSRCTCWLWWRWWLRYSHGWKWGWGRGHSFRWRGRWWDVGHGGRCCKGGREGERGIT